MRVMVMVKANAESEAGVMPSEELIRQMTEYNEALVKAGVMLAGDGLHPSSRGARVKFSGDKRTVVDGPFAETKELIAGYWILQVKSLDEAIEWAKRLPAPDDARKAKLRSANFSSWTTSVPARRSITPVVGSMMSREGAWQYGDG